MPWARSSMRDRNAGQSGDRERRFGGNGAETYDELDALGNRHIQLLNGTRRHQNQKPAGRVGSRRDKNADRAFRPLMKSLVLLSRNEADRALSRARKFDENHLFERGLVRRKRLVDLLDRNVDFVQQWHPQQALIQQLNYLFPVIIRGEPAN